MIFNGYRPVSLMYTLSKVFEKIVYYRLPNFLDYQKILIGNQFRLKKTPFDLYGSYIYDGPGH